MATLHQGHTGAWGPGGGSLVTRAGHLGAWWPGPHGGGWPGVSVSLVCVRSGVVASVSLHVSVSQSQGAGSGSRPSPHYPPHSAPGCWHWARLRLRLWTHWTTRPPWLTAPLLLSSLYRAGPGPTRTGKQPAQACEPRWEALTISNSFKEPLIGGRWGISAWDWPTVITLPTLETDIADTYQDIDSSPSSRPLSQYEGFIVH